MKLTRGPQWSILALLALASGAAVGCSRDVEAVSPQDVQQQYGVDGAFTDKVQTPDGTVDSTVVPVTMPDGRKAQLVLPKHKADDPHSIYLKDQSGLHPVRVARTARRADVVQAPSVVAQTPEAPHAKKRSWEKDALIIGGGAGAGAAIGAIAGGGKGAAIGGAAGGIGGLIYDIATRDKEGKQ